MIRKIAGIVLVAALATGCAEASPDAPTGTPPVSPPTTVPTPPDEGSLGGFGAPARVEGEFPDGTGRPVRGTLTLSEDGCWYVLLGGSRFLAVLPVGFVVPASDATAIVDPDGISYRSNVDVDGTAFAVPIVEAPGGDAGRWAEYARFCRPSETSLAVFDTLRPAFDPATLTPSTLEALVADAAFTRSWPCGRGWAMSTDDERVALFIYERAPSDPNRGTIIALPDEAWSAEVVVGEHLFVNHCDDVAEPWEPDPVVAARWPVTAGEIEVLDEVPTGTDSAQVRAVLSGAMVTTDSGASITVGPVDLVNTSFNLFAG